jgi:predicted kinase
MDKTKLSKKLSKKIGKNIDNVVDLTSQIIFSRYGLDTSYPIEIVRGRIKSTIKKLNKMNIKHLKEPFVVILIGPPLSGKTTWIKENFSDKEFELISRDQIVMDVYGSDNYDEAFKHVNQKEVDRVLHQTLVDANKNNKNAIVDMTHMSGKRRAQNLAYFSDDYYKLGVIFPILTDEEYERRNTKRSLEENKNLPMHIIKRMISQYQPIKQIEGFNKVISL